MTTFFNIISISFINLPHLPKTMWQHLNHYGDLCDICCTNITTRERRTRVSMRMNNLAILNNVLVIFSFTVVDKITPHNGTHKQLTNVYFKSPESPQFYFSKILSTKIYLRLEHANISVIFIVKQKCYLIQKYVELVLAFYDQRRH